MNQAFQIGEFEDYIVFDFGANTCIGKIVPDPLQSGFVVDNPRVMQLFQPEKNKIMINWLKLVGSPKRLYLPANTAYYHPVDEVVVKGYIQMTSGLSVVQSIPGAKRNR